MSKDIKELYSLYKTKKTPESYMSFSYDKEIIEIGGYSEIKKLLKQKESSLDAEYIKLQYSYSMDIATLEDIARKSNIKEICIVTAREDDRGFNKKAKIFKYIPENIYSKMFESAVNYSDIYEYPEYISTEYDNTISEEYEDILIKLNILWHECSKTDTKAKVIDLIDSNKLIPTERFGPSFLSVKNVKYRILALSRYNNRITRYGRGGKYDLDDAYRAYKAIKDTLYHEIKISDNLSSKEIKELSLNYLKGESTSNEYLDIKGILPNLFELENKYSVENKSQFYFSDKFNYAMYIKGIEEIFNKYIRFSSLKNDFLNFKGPKDGIRRCMNKNKIENSEFKYLLFKLEQKKRELIDKSTKQVITKGEKRINFDKLESNLLSLYPEYKYYKKGYYYIQNIPHNFYYMEM